MNLEGDESTLYGLSDEDIKYIKYRKLVMERHILSWNPHLFYSNKTYEEVYGEPLIRGAFFNKALILAEWLFFFPDKFLFSARNFFD